LIQRNDVAPPSDIRRFGSGMLSFDGSSRTATLRLGPSLCVLLLPPLFWLSRYVCERSFAAFGGNAATPIVPPDSRSYCHQLVATRPIVREQKIPNPA
jgi:hypothetical protein